MAFFMVEWHNFLFSSPKHPVSSDLGLSGEAGERLQTIDQDHPAKQGSSRQLMIPCRVSGQWLSQRMGEKNRNSELRAISAPQATR
jgi:hypothetical protein